MTSGFESLLRDVEEPQTVSESDNNPLLCCPFCGGMAELRSDSDDITMDGKLPHWVCCTKCMGNAGSHYESEDAISTWNERAS